MNFSLNDISNNNNFGLRFNGISDSAIIENICSNNHYNGLVLNDTNNCKLQNNILISNSKYAIYLDSNSSSNLISHNRFINNNENGISQCYDDGTANLWYDSKNKEGNYWSNLGKNKTYEIDGMANSIDEYPLNVDLKRISYSHFMIAIAAICFAIIFLRRRKLN